MSDDQVVMRDAFAANHSTLGLLLSQDEAVIKSSWAAQMQKAKERPNLAQWRDELVAITKDSSEDFEEATLSVEVMRMRCDVCYHEKSVRNRIVYFALPWILVGTCLLIGSKALYSPSGGILILMSLLLVILIDILTLLLVGYTIHAHA